MAKFYVEFAQAVRTYKAAGSTDMLEGAYKLLSKLSQSLPSGSGLDRNPRLYIDQSREDRLIFQADFHHMNDVGFYDGWTNHNVIVTPSLAFGFNIRVTGRNRNDIKDHIETVFYDFLMQEVE